MPKLPKSYEEFRSTLPDLQNELEGHYNDFLERLREVSPELVKRHEDYAALEFADEGGLGELVALIRKPDSAG